MVCIVYSTFVDRYNQTMATQRTKYVAPLWLNDNINRHGRGSALAQILINDFVPSVTGHV